MEGSKHLEFLLNKDLLNIQASPILEKLYSEGKKPFNPTTDSSQRTTSDSPDTEETMVLHKAQGKDVAEILEIPELYIELDRAVWQVEKALQEEKDLKKTKADSENSDSKKEK